LGGGGEVRARRREERRKERLAPYEESSRTVGRWPVHNSSP